MSRSAIGDPPLRTGDTFHIAHTGNVLVVDVASGVVRYRRIGDAGKPGKIIEETDEASFRNRILWRN